MLGLAKVRKTAPQLRLGDVKPVADGKTLEAIIANRYEVMAKYARSLRQASRAEVRRLKSEGAASCRQARRHAAGAPLAAPRRRQDPARGEAARSPSAVAHSPGLAKLVAMREELRPLWTRTNVSAEQLVADLQAWCARPRRAASPRCRSSR